MAVTKQSSIKLGQGALTTKNGESQIFCEQRAPIDGIPSESAWSVGTSYSLGAAVRYGEYYYNSLQAGNLGNQPDTSPLWWIQIDGKDGDMWIQTPVAGYPAGGSDVSFFQKKNNAWTSLAYNPLKISLVDGQIAPATAFQVVGSAFRFLQIDYTVRRGSGHGRKRAGKITVLNDGSNVIHDHSYNEIGSDVNVPFDVDISGGYVRLRYTSALEGSAIELAYYLKGWV